MSTMIPAVGYLRCSTDQQEESPEQQKIEILAYARTAGYDVIRWFEDFGKSGTTFDQRPEFQRLRSAVEYQPEFKAVICYDESRWGRAIDAEENTYWRVHFRRCGVEVVLVKTSVDPKHEFAPMLKALEGVQASQYSKKLSELTLRGATNNGVYSSGGTAPYGYVRVAVSIHTGDRRYLAPGQWCVKKQEKVVWELGKDDEVETVRFIFSERAKGCSYLLIAKMLNDKKVPCARRGKWRNKDQKWSNGTIKSIIENPAYYGARAYNRYSSSKIRAQNEGWERRSTPDHPQWKMDQSQWVVHEGAHPAIVPQELWMKANSVRKGKWKGGSPRHFVPYLLSGLIECGKCGFSFEGQSTTLRDRKYYRYVCGGYNRKRVCDYTSVPRDKVESFVVDAVEDVLSDNRILDQVQRNLKDMLERAPDQDRVAMEADTRRIQALDEKIGRVLQAIEEGGPISVLVAKLKKLQDEKSEAEASLQQSAPKSGAKLDLDVIARVIRDFSDNFRHAFEGGSTQEKKEIIRRVVGKVVVDGESRRVRVLVRRFPKGGDPADRLVEEFEKAGAAPENQMPFRNIVVPGTGLEPARPRGH